MTEGPQQPRREDSPKTSSSEEKLQRLRARRSVAGERYQLDGEIGRGGMGAVLRVRDLDLQRNLAMKVVLGQGAGASTGSTPPVDPQVLQRFLDEAQITGQLDHPGVVPVHELGIDADGRVYFTMRLVKGDTVDVVFGKARAGEDGWTETRVLEVILKVCDTMAFAHQKGVLHRDLKPSNVMVGKFGEVYVMDWGLAKVVGDEDRRDLRLRPEAPVSRVRTDRSKDEADSDSPILTMDGAVVGTPCYMAPEQAEGRIEVLDQRADVYAVGAMLYQLLTGQQPYVCPGARLSPYMVLAAVRSGPPAAVHSLRKGVPAELVAICERAMARELGHRYSAMRELSDDVRAYLEKRVVKAYRTGPVAELMMWVRRNWALSASITAMLALTISSLVAISWVQAHSNKELAIRNVDLATAKVALEAANERFGEASQIAGAQQLGWSLSDRAARRGRVVTADGAMPIPDAVIGTPGWFPAQRQGFDAAAIDLQSMTEVARTDAGGEFTIPEGVLGQVFLVRAPGLAAGLVRRAALGAVDGAVAEIRLRPGGAFSARVVDAARIPRTYQVRLLTPANTVPALEFLGSSTYFVGARGFTDADGRVRLEGLLTEEFTVELWCGGKVLRREPGQLSFARGQTESKEWRLGFGCDVGGRVVDQRSLPVGNQTLWLVPRTGDGDRTLLFGYGENSAARVTTTDSNGQFTLTDVDPGAWWIGIAPLVDPAQTGGDPERLAPGAEALSVPANTRSMNVVVRAHRGLYIRGAVVDEFGKTIECDVSTERLSNHQLLVAHAKDGTFVIGPLIPGQYPLVAEQPNYNRSVPRLICDGSVTASAGQDDVVIRLVRSATIRCRAVNDVGGIVPARFFLLNRERATTWFRGAEEEVASYEGIPRGVFEVVATTRTGLAGRVLGLSVKPGDALDDVQVHLEQGARIEIRYVGKPEQERSVFIRFGKNAAPLDELRTESTSVICVPPGRVDISWSVASLESQLDHADGREELTLAAGDVRKIEFPRKQ